MSAKITTSSAKWIVQAQPDPPVSIMLRASRKPKIVAPATPRSPEGPPSSGGPSGCSSRSTPTATCSEIPDVTPLFPERAG